MIDLARLVLGVDGTAKIVQQRLDVGDGVAILDWLNYSKAESTYYRDCNFGRARATDDHFLRAVSARMVDIYGNGFYLRDQLPRGRNFYTRSWGLGPNARFGFVGWGGQANTVGVTITGTGCLHAAAGWEARLERFLVAADNAQISRIDLAHDDFGGERYTIDTVIHGYHRGFFHNGGRPPNIELRGNHIHPDGRGRSIYVGSRGDSYCRIYEKGKQLGNPNSDWVRIEVELHNANRVLPYDMVTHPGQYLAATYPYLSGLSAQQCRIATRQKIQNADYDAMRRWLRHQCGAAISLMVAVDGADATIDYLRRDFRAKAHQIFPGLAMPQAEETEPTSVTTPTEE